MKRYLAFFFAAYCICICALAGCTAGREQKTAEPGIWFEAVVLERSDHSLLVEPAEGTPEKTSADRILIGTDGIKEEQTLRYLAEASVGDRIRAGYRGGIAESYPAMINGAFQIELIKKAEALPNKMIMVDGVLYQDTGKVSRVDKRCGVMDGEITSSVDGGETPEKDNQSNFGSGYGYQYGAIETIEVYMDEKWMIFEKRSEDKNTIIFHGRAYNTGALSRETLQWLAWYHSLPEEERLAVNGMPAELVPPWSEERKDADAGG